MPLPDHLVDRVVGVVEVLLPAARGAAGDVVSRVHLRPIIADDPAADCCGGADGGRRANVVAVHVAVGPQLTR